MSNGNITLQEKFAKLTPLQREKFNALKNSAELDAALAEANISLTDEEKDALLKQAMMAAGVRELTDAEAEQAAGGAGFRQCPHGHFEATGFANIMGPSKDCEVGVCVHFQRTLTNTQEWIFDHQDPSLPNDTQTSYVYIERCSFFNREIERSYSSPKRVK